MGKNSAAEWMKNGTYLKKSKAEQVLKDINQQKRYEFI